MSKTVMVVDSSARAHAVAAAYMRSGNRIIVFNNDLIAYRPPQEVILVKGVNLKDPEAVVRVAQEHKPTLIDVCQDDALAAGVVDACQKAGFTVFGPTRAAARLEWDKDWSRRFMRDNRIPHPQFESFIEADKGFLYLRRIFEDDPHAHIFVKASGLCAGKGAIGASSLEEAMEAVRRIRNVDKFGNAGNTFLIEEAMQGPEASIYALCDGQNFKLVKPAMDFKRAYSGDLGPNTGGMGSIAPTAVMTPDLMDYVGEKIVAPTLKGMNALGTPYVGVLYVGIMVVDEAGKKVPKVIEFNSRWGAPEAEVVIPGIQTPMDEIAEACLEGRLADLKIQEDNRVRVCVVGASRGYPGDYSGVKGKKIQGLEEVMCMQHVTVFGAGIKVDGGRFFANGGRLFSLVGEGKNVKEARECALEAMAIVWIEDNGLHYRTDIGHQDMERYWRR